MRVYTQQDTRVFSQTRDTLVRAEGDAYLLSAMPPLFAMPERLMQALAKQSGNTELPTLWQRSLMPFRRNIKQHCLSLILLDPQIAALTPDLLHPLTVDSETVGVLSYTEEQYALHIHRLYQLEKQYENLRVSFRNDIAGNTVLYVKENIGVIMAKTDSPMSAFVSENRNMISAFRDYLTV